MNNIFKNLTTEQQEFFLDVFWKNFNEKMNRGIKDKVKDILKDITLFYCVGVRNIKGNKVYKIIEYTAYHEKIIEKSPYEIVLREDFNIENICQSKEEAQNYINL